MFRKTLLMTTFSGVLALGVSGAMALFTSQATVDANTFTTGTVIISTNPTTALVTFSNMAPGDLVTAPITVQNDGTLELRYAVTSVATNGDTKDLMTKLNLTIKSNVANCTNGGFGGSGSQLYTGALGSVVGIKVVGDSTPGAQAGDRTLAASASEVLCFNVALPLNSNDTYQAATTTATFTFAAEQTKNNP